jgi:hypothetical protein
VEGIRAGIGNGMGIGIRAIGDDRVGWDSGGGNRDGIGAISNRTRKNPQNATFREGFGIMKQLGGDYL